MDFVGMHTGDSTRDREFALARRHGLPEGWRIEVDCGPYVRVIDAEGVERERVYTTDIGLPRYCGLGDRAEWERVLDLVSKEAVRRVRVIVEVIDE